MTALVLSLDVLNRYTTNSAHVKPKPGFNAMQPGEPGAVIVPLAPQNLSAWNSLGTFISSITHVGTLRQQPSLGQTCLAAGE